jgi:hypothetical protein
MDEDPSSDVTILSGPPLNPGSPFTSQQSHESESAPSSQPPARSPSPLIANPPIIFSVDSDSTTDSESDSIVLPSDTSPSSAELRFLEKLREARERYAEMVQDALRELGRPPPLTADLEHPPTVEQMTDLEMEEELATFGFRFTTREAAISKLTRCWAAQKNAKALEQPNLTPIDFIRTQSQYYEQILTYGAIPLAALWREMSDAGVKISIHRLKTMLDEEGVAFLDEAAAGKR